MCNPVDQPRYADGGVIDRPTWQQFFRSIQSQILLAMQEFDNLMDRPGNRVTVGRVMEFSAVAKLVPNGLWKLCVRAIEKKKC